LSCWVRCTVGGRERTFGAMNKYAFIENELERRRTDGLLRHLRPLSGSGVEVELGPVGGGRRLVNFSSNDYLGLAGDERLRQRAAEFTSLYGNGATAARLVCGEHPGFARVEASLARLKQRESALVLNSGFQANVSLLAALADRNSLILIDRLAHNSLYQGAILSRARIRRYRHADLAHLEQLLVAGGDFQRRFIVSETVFSMDGDRSDVAALARLACDHDAFLMLDEAHATGVAGPDGMGLSVGHKVDLVVGTCGKALGAFGAYIACDRLVRDYVVNCCAGFVYSTALPPGVLGAIDAALELVPQMEAQRSELQEKAVYLRRRLAVCGWDTALSQTQIIPLVIGSEAAALQLAAWLEKRGALAVAIRPPTVATGQARVRLALSAAHTWEQVEWLAGLLEEYRSAGG
jgi:8-amino-7-oxononanoate synthase